jgi:hypothetical protein
MSQHATHASFIPYLEILDRDLARLKEDTLKPASALPAEVGGRGIYVFYEGNSPLYVGRSNTLRKRIQQHCRPASTHNQATFAYRIAGTELGLPRAGYHPDDSRARRLETNAALRSAFSKAKERIRAMSVRILKVDDPRQQALFELYAAIVFETPYNDFDNH